jgi:zinc/manganese transport system substrate-binding protein
MKTLRLIGLFCALPALSPAAELRVTALHPLMADLARQVGGNRVEVYDLVGEGGNPHRFEPKPEDLRKMRSSALVLAAGKGLEHYLDRIRATLGDTTVVEVGRTIPSLKIGKDSVYSCCPTHGAGAADPHWWQGIENMRRASRIVADAFSQKDPAGSASYRANAAAYSQRLRDLRNWANGELSGVPRSKRKLVTSHTAFAYFAKEFGFQTIAVAGLNQEQDTTAKQRATVIEAVRESGTTAIFPETGSGNRHLEAVASASGAKLADPLIADGNGRGKEAGFEGMIRHNVKAITKALVP